MANKKKFASWTREAYHLETVFIFVQGIGWPLWIYYFSSDFTLNNNSSPPKKWSLYHWYYHNIWPLESLNKAGCPGRLILMSPVMNVQSEIRKHHNPQCLPLSSSEVNDGIPHLLRSLLTSMVSPSHYGGPPRASLFPRSLEALWCNSQTAKATLIMKLPLV